MRLLLLLMALWIAPASAALADTIRLFSYDPADVETREATGPVTLQFRQGLIHVTIMTLQSTEADAKTDLVHVPDGALGVGVMARLLGKDEAWRDLYRVRDTDEGAALMQALCHASKGWLAIGRPRFGESLAIYVLAQSESGGPRLCRTLNFTFHGEWRVPHAGSFDTRLLDHAREGPL